MNYREFRNNFFHFPCSPSEIKVMGLSCCQILLFDKIKHNIYRSWFDPSLKFCMLFVLHISVLVLFYFVFHLFKIKKKKQANYSNQIVFVFFFLFNWYFLIQNISWNIFRDKEEKGLQHSYIEECTQGDFLCLIFFNFDFFEVSI